MTTISTRCSELLTNRQITSRFNGNTK